MLRIVLSAGILAFAFLFEVVFDGIDVFIDIVFDLLGIFVFDVGDFLDVVGVFCLLYTSDAADESLPV